MSNRAVLFFFPEATQERSVVTDKDGRPLLFRDTAAALMWAYRQPSVHGDGWQAYDIGPVSDDATTDQIMGTLEAASIERAKPSLRGSWADMAGRWPANGLSQRDTTTMDEVTDERLQHLLDFMRPRDAGAFCNFALTVSEVRSMAAELLRLRDKPLHCPGCDGDHL